MELFARIALYGFPIFAIGLFALLRPRHAMFATIMIGLLFLPEASIKIEGLPDYSKSNVTTFSALLAALLFDGGRFFQIRPRLTDLPMLLWLLMPTLSGAANDLPAWDCIVSGPTDQFLHWGIPYLLGRAYITDLSELRELAMAVVIAGLVYTPFCLWEMRMSAQLHVQIYGFYARGSIMARYGDFGLPLWRPTVFLPHGLYVGVLLSGCALVAFWLWINDTVKNIFSWLPMSYAFAILYIAACLTQVATGVGIVTMTIVAALLTRWFRSGIFLLMVFLIPAAFMTLRLSGSWSVNGALEMIKVVSERRAESLGVRVKNDNLLMERALEQPLFGWGSWGRNRVIDERGRDNVFTDGLWIILLGQNGLVGLAAFTVAITLPGVLLWKRLRGDQWKLPSVGAAAGLACFANAYVIDALVNATLNSVTMLSIGALSSVIWIYAIPQRTSRPISFPSPPGPTFPVMPRPSP